MPARRGPSAVRPRTRRAAADSRAPRAAGRRATGSRSSACRSRSRCGRATRKPRSILHFPRPANRSSVWARVPISRSRWSSTPWPPRPISARSRGRRARRTRRRLGARGSLGRRYPRQHRRGASPLDGRTGTRVSVPTMFRCGSASPTRGLCERAVRWRRTAVGATPPRPQLATETAISPPRTHFSRQRKRRDIGWVWVRDGVASWPAARRLDLGEDAPPSPAERLGLTDRELDVLALVAEGRTNRQIGAGARSSRAKTASVHVSNILAKLGVANRGEAAAAAAPPRTRPVRQHPRSFPRMSARITVVGGGSYHWAPRLLADFANTPSLDRRRRRAARPRRRAHEAHGGARQRDRTPARHRRCTRARRARPPAPRSRAPTS